MKILENETFTQNLSSFHFLQFNYFLLYLSILDDILDRLCAGVAGNCSKESMDLKTVFSYLQSPYFSSADVLWLDIALVTIYRHGNKTVLNTLAVDSTDTPLHAVTRFSLLTSTIVSYVLVNVTHVSKIRV